MYEAVSVKEHL
jgi:hypothetical protein